MTFLRTKPESEEYKKRVAVFEKIRDEMILVFQVIFNENKWCKRALCRDAEGEQLFNPSDEKATQWCLLGAIYKHENWSDETLTFLTNYARMRGIEDLSRYNDQEGHTAVITLLVEVLDTLGVSLTFYDENGKKVTEL
jgi:hypothetical protein